MELILAPFWNDQTSYEGYQVFHSESLDTLAVDNLAQRAKQFRKSRIKNLDYVLLTSNLL